MKKTYISPVTSFLMSLSIVAGIFVAGLTNSRVLPVAKAQTAQSVTGNVPEATVAGTVIAVKGLVINGVATDALIPGGVRITDGAVNAGCGFTALGFSATGDAVYALGAYSGGVFTSGNDHGGDITPNEGGVFTSGNSGGVFTSGNDNGGDPAAGLGGVFTSGNVYVGDSLQVVGGVLSGSDIQVVNGIVSGSDLQVSGGYVASVCGN